MVVLRLINIKKLLDNKPKAKNKTNITNNYLESSKIQPWKVFHKNQEEHFDVT